MHPRLLLRGQHGGQRVGIHAIPRAQRLGEGGGVAKVVRALRVRAVRPRLEQDRRGAALCYQRREARREHLDRGVARHLARGRLRVVVHHDKVPRPREQRCHVRGALVVRDKLGLHSVAPVEELAQGDAAAQAAVLHDRAAAQSLEQARRVVVVDDAVAKEGNRGLALLSASSSLGRQRLTFFHRCEATAQPVLTPEGQEDGEDQARSRKYCTSEHAGVWPWREARPASPSRYVCARQASRACV